MSKKQGNVAKDTYEEEYGPMQTIYITEAAQKRLNGDERHGKWYLTDRYSTSPTKEFCIKTTVPRSSLRNGVFHPDRFEPDIVAERCEKVSPKEFASPAKVNKSGPRFRAGMKVQRTFYGLGGYTETDEDVVESVKNGVVRTVECKNSITFDAVTGKELENFFPGMHQKIVPLDELPKPDSKKPKKSR